MTPNNTPLSHEAKVCLVTDWLTNLGGAERVLFALAQIFPTAPIFTTVHSHDAVKELFPDKTRVRTSYLQKLPILNRKHQALLPLLSHAIEQHDLSEFDLIISLSSCVAKNVKKTRKEQTHVCYIHTPIRYAWEPALDSRVSNLPWGARSLASRMLDKIKQHDFHCRSRPDFYIANSIATAKKVKDFYQIKASVLYPPYDDVVPDLAQDRNGDYLALGRLVPYKRFDLAIEAFRNLPTKQLVIAGTGPDESRLRALAKDSANIRFAGRVDEDVKNELLSKSRAFLLPQQEDAGIVQLEAMARGTPVIAFGRGGAVDVVRHGVNGILFHEQTSDCLISAINELESHQFGSKVKQISNSVTEYSRSNFQQNFRDLLNQITNRNGIHTRVSDVVERMQTPERV
ncbi:MAG TPA: glycosyltransferase family 4 protein [Rhodopirellula baltica]|uniref:Mannosyl transferase n=1 Tax=Rhodopirellula baltica (strain DSM 10527 / NCIMB 13988 / SH1) TaxID=243090 RepID=Q7UF01_RHOBA|nr:glycosyltransferase [Rhodopirellula baltica]CAD78882.1 mannosyl transferase [Rhodopirellula baltica SH 1]HBE64505.1 glycosyltransferase family 4 protein [Rhodopirellula baltica]